MLALFKEGRVLIGWQFVLLISWKKKKKYIESDSDAIIPLCHYRYSCGVYSAVLLI